MNKLIQVKAELEKYNDKATGYEADCELTKTPQFRLVVYTKAYGETHHADMLFDPDKLGRNGKVKLLSWVARCVDELEKRLYGEEETE